MPLIVIGLVLLFANPNVGIFVIVLGVMVWTSRKSRKILRDTAEAEAEADRVRDETDPAPQPMAQIVHIHRARDADLRQHGR